MIHRPLAAVTFIADEEERKRAEREKNNEQTSSSTDTGTTQTSGGTVSPPLPSPQRKVKRFFGSVAVNPTRLIKDAGQIADEVLQHLTTLNTDVQVTIEIQIHITESVPDNAIRTVTENCRVLKFQTHDFEEE